MKKLVENSQQETRRVYGLLDVKYIKAMLNYHKQGLTIYSTNHVYNNLIAKPIDRVDFYLIVKETINKFSYWKNNCV